ncbi:cell envelope biogenesis protein TolA [Enterobacter roggenkampii]|uniref:cell envelope integrity TolA C-terminal domain-containing protein n=1 Tax=Enterobacter roggenkampii TaxID=1812935 RepID=UPI00242BA455|nr:cell envelope integrity TolA C-terminal domain-containing protein [Enterobacter roggenkampii]WFX59454.1 cell envelope biogenesis protein TolA [Enterobacter roggenkampii]
MTRLLCFLVFFLVGCHGPKQQTLTPKQKQDFPIINEWAVSFKQAVESRFPSASKYAGDTCTISVHQPKGTNKITNMHVVEGSPELCKAAVKAIKAASDDGLLPLTPEPIGEEFPLDFKP